MVGIANGVVAEKTFAVVVDECLPPVVEMVVVAFGWESFIWIGRIPINRGGCPVSQRSTCWFAVTTNRTLPMVLVV